MILLLLIPVLGALIHLAVVAHVKTTLVSAAGDGAREAALFGAPVHAAESRVRERVGSALGGQLVEAVIVGRSHDGGVPIVTVEVRGRIPAWGVAGPATTVRGTGRAVAQVVP